MTVALLGLGSMGLSLAKQVLKADEYSLHVWNRTQDRTGISDVAATGAKLCFTATEAVKHSDVVLTCVLDYETVYEILDSLHADALKEKVVINLTNCTPKQAREMSSFMKEQYNVRAYFDGAIMATPKMIGTEYAFIFCSGEDESALPTPLSEGQSAHDILSSFGHVDYLGPDPGSAALHDLALLAGMYGMFSGTLTAIALLSKRITDNTSSLSPKISQIISTKLAPLIQSLTPSLVEIAVQTEENEKSAGDHPNSMMYHGMKNILLACREEGVDGGGLVHLMGKFEEVVSQGGGEGGMGLVGRKYWSLDG